MHAALVDIFMCGSLHSFMVAASCLNFVWLRILFEELSVLTPEVLLETRHSATCMSVRRDRNV